MFPYCDLRHKKLETICKTYIQNLHHPESQTYNHTETYKTFEIYNWIPRPDSTQQVLDLLVSQNVSICCASVSQGCVETKKVTQNHESKVVRLFVARAPCG